ncbi:hypothetical protein GCM10028778_06890 [Barrientosiimonas marina]|uniref:DUF3951 domain-containing protein n=1 Tax=Lentibacillus kimchii TaxID=1542911 RepID=A0ABW2UXH0_9BACI
MIGIIFSVFVILVVSIGIYKMVSGKGTPSNSYTPFDHITGQTDTAFHEEKEYDEKEKN